MATIVKTPSGTWKALVRKTGFPTTIKTFRLKRDAEDWARRTEDEMVRGMFIQRAPAEKLTFEKAMQRYLAEVTPTKRPMTQRGEHKKSVPLIDFFGKYSLAAITGELIAQYRDKRLAGEDRKMATISPFPVPRIPFALSLHCLATSLPSLSKNGGLAFPTIRRSMFAAPHLAPGVIAALTRRRRKSCSPPSTLTRTPCFAGWFESHWKPACARPRLPPYAATRSTLIGALFDCLKPRTRFHAQRAGPVCLDRFSTAISGALRG